MKMNTYRSVVTVYAILGLLVLGGCASGPTAYDVRGQADPVLNRDVSGKSLSVVVRLYQLKQATEFSKLAFESLATGRPEAELLGAELIDKSEVVVLPGTQHISTGMLSENANYLGVVAFFRQPEPHFWRYLIPASQIRSKGVTFRLQDCYITLVDGKPEAIPGQLLGAKPECNNATATSNLKVAPTSGTPQTTSTPAQPSTTVNNPPKKTSKVKRAYDIGNQVLDPVIDGQQLLEKAASTQIPSTSAIKVPSSAYQPNATNINLQLPR